MGADPNPKTDHGRPPAPSSPSPRPKSTTGAPAKRPVRPKKPNYAHIHRNPLPLTTHPLPPLHPTNPLSLLHYAYTYLSQLLSPPSSHPDRLLTAYFSPATRSVHVTDPHTIRQLWEMGFFGKGTLSRSEPSWLEREEARRTAERSGGGTAEEATRKRREERRGFKMERARVEAERVRMQRLVEEGKLGKEVLEGKEEEKAGLLEGAQSVASAEMDSGDVEHAAATIAVAEGRVPDAELLNPPAPTPPLPEILITASNGSDATPPDLLPPITPQEHLQLTLEEAFFLSFGLGVLAILPSPSPSKSTPTSKSTPLTPRTLLHLFAAHSTFPPNPILPSHPPTPPPTNPFLLTYTVYHHYRSLGWTIRPGTKFGVDYLLYNRGPVFSHAEFAILILPAYIHAYWSTTEGRRLREREAPAGVGGREGRDWWWLHAVSRVQSQVKKSLALVYVEVPPPLGLVEGREMGLVEGEVGVGALLGRYKVREFVLRRWLMNRSRG